MLSRHRFWLCAATPKFATQPVSFVPLIPAWPGLLVHRGLAAGCVVARFGPRLIRRRTPDTQRVLLTYHGLARANRWQHLLLTCGDAIAA